MISAISLQGFKSFADRSRLEFEGGITAIIGPNGSGKSNVVEAIRWATHSARARELRAGRATELVFHGSGGKAPVGLAEVTLELRNLPGVARLNVARRVYRDGTGEQDLDARPARARDVQNALRGSGLGPGGLAVIGQGEVSSVVQAEPGVLLGYLEEAANLSRLRSARNETQGKLGDADAALSTLRLLEGDLRVRVEKLAGEAATARRARTLALRDLALRDALGRARQESLVAEVAALRAREAELLATSDAVSVNVRETQAELESLRESIVAATERVSAHRQALELFRAAQNASDQADAYLGHLRAEAERLARERSALDLRTPDRAAPDITALDAAVRNARAASEALDRDVRKLDADVARLRTAHSRRAEGVARQDAQRSTLTEELERAENDLTRVLPLLEQARDAARAAREEREAREEAYRAVVAERDGCRAQLRELRAEEQSLNAARAPLLREKSRLETLLASFARYGEGPRNALRSGIPGILGAVADLLHVPGEYESAVTAALGRRLEQVVVEDADVARAVIEHLKRVGGRATFLPLDLLRLRSRRDAQLLREPGVVGNLADLCPSDPPVVSNNLLSDSLLVEDMRVATRLARQHANRPRLITLDGEVLESGGALTGGRLRDSGASHLADQRRLSELEQELRDGEARTLEVARLIERRAAEQSALDARHDEVMRARESAARVEREREREVSAAEANVSQARRTRDALRERLGQALPVASVNEELPDLSEREVALLRAREALERARLQEREANEALSAGRELHAAWKSFRSAMERAGVIEARRLELEPSIRAQEERAREAREEVDRRRVDLGDLDEQELPRLERLRIDRTNAYTSLIGRQNKLRAELEDVRVTLARRESAIEEVPHGALLPGSPREWQAELTRVQRDITDIGVVNALAEREHALEQERLDALAAQREDAERSVAELRAMLDELERDAQMALNASFARVERAFVEYSRELLGGVGELHAERDERSYFTGLRLAVQPKGKRTRAMNLLSAGERTMAGLAFLFALGHATEDRGLPLAVLDEVDAPLDEANIRRFTRFLEVFAARGAQFILVTHQKATMEVATALWGVTTDATGASRVLSIKHAAEVGVHV